MKEVRKTTPYNHAIGCVTVYPTIFCLHSFLGTKVNLASYHYCQQNTHVIYFFCTKSNKSNFKINVTFDFHFILCRVIYERMAHLPNFYKWLWPYKSLHNINQNKTSIIGNTLHFPASCFETPISQFSLLHRQNQFSWWF